MSRGRSARRKGLTFERDVAQMLRHIFPGVRRQLEFHEADAKGVDLQGCDPFKIQCKKTKKYVPLSTIKEIQCDREFGDVPVLVAAGDDQEALACLPLSLFVGLVRKAYGRSKDRLVICHRCTAYFKPEETQKYQGLSFCSHCYSKAKREL